MKALFPQTPTVSFRSATEQSAVQMFEHALSEGGWWRLMRKLRRQPTELLIFQQLRECLNWQGQVGRGIHTVELNQVVGTMRMSNEFDAMFHPANRTSKFRWISVATAWLKDIPLPPIELIKVGDNYFVEDGNHRISVARALGVDYLEANIIEINIEQVLDLTKDICDTQS